MGKLRPSQELTQVMRGRQHGNPSERGLRTDRLGLEAQPGGLGSVPLPLRAPGFLSVRGVSTVLMVEHEMRSLNAY